MSRYFLVLLGRTAQKLPLANQAPYYGHASADHQNTTPLAGPNDNRTVADHQHPTAATVDPTQYRTTADHGDAAAAAASKLATHDGPRDWSTDFDASNPSLNQVKTSGHGSIIATVSGDDPNYLLTQMSDGSYQRVNKATGAVDPDGAGRWGDGQGGDQSVAGIGNPQAPAEASAAAADGAPASSPPASQPNYDPVTHVTTYEMNDKIRADYEAAASAGGVTSFGTGSASSTTDLPDPGIAGLASDSIPGGRGGV